MPKALLGSHGTNLAANKRYDQILHLPTLTDRFTERAGVVDFYAGDFRPLFHEWLVSPLVTIHEPARPPPEPNVHG